MEHTAKYLFIFLLFVGITLQKAIRPKRSERVTEEEASISHRFVETIASYDANAISVVEVAMING